MRSTLRISKHFKVIYDAARIDFPLLIQRISIWLQYIYIWMWRDETADYSNMCQHLWTYMRDANTHTLVLMLNEIIYARILNVIHIIHSSMRRGGAVSKARAAISCASLSISLYHRARRRCWRIDLTTRTRWRRAAPNGMTILEMLYGQWCAMMNDNWRINRIPHIHIILNVDRV